MFNICASSVYHTLNNFLTQICHQKESLNINKLSDIWQLWCTLKLEYKYEVISRK